MKKPVIKNGANQSSTNLSDYAYDCIKESISSRKYLPGTILSEIKISEDLHISRTPTKTALYNLAIDGLIEIVPNKGYLVKEFGVKEIVEITQAREALESMSIQLACERLTDNDIAYIRELFPETPVPYTKENRDELIENGRKLHAFLIKTSGNSIIANLLEKLNNQIKQTNSISAQFEERNEAAYLEHCRMADALAAGNSELAAQCMREHISNQRMTLIKFMLF